MKNRSDQRFYKPMWITSFIVLDTVVDLRKILSVDSRSVVTYPLPRFQLTIAGRRRLLVEHHPNRPTSRNGELHEAERLRTAAILGNRVKGSQVDRAHGTADRSTPETKPT